MTVSMAACVHIGWHQRCGICHSIKRPKPSTWLTPNARHELDAQVLGHVVALSISLTA